MSATPMQDSPHEIIYPLNLILPLGETLPEPSKDMSIPKQINKDKFMKLYITGENKVSNKLQTIFSKYISYLTIPRNDRVIKRYRATDPEISTYLYISEMNENQKKAYKDIVKRNSDITEKKSTIYHDEIQASNFVFPVGGKILFGNDGRNKWLVQVPTVDTPRRLLYEVEEERKMWGCKKSDNFKGCSLKQLREKLMKDHGLSIKKVNGYRTKTKALKDLLTKRGVKSRAVNKAVKSIKKINILEDFTFNNEVDTTIREFKNDSDSIIEYISTNFSSKYGNALTEIMKFITQPEKGCIFVYFTIVNGGGAIIFANLLIALGLFRYSTNKNREGVKFEIITSDTRDGFITSDILNTFNSSDNVDGSKIKVLIGSQVIGTGISIFHCKQVHIMNPFWNLSGIDQALGRVFRLDSHADLLEDTNEAIEVDIFMHVSVLNKENKLIDFDINSVDGKGRESLTKNVKELGVEYLMYMLAFKKDREIKLIERSIKINATDCSLTKNRNLYINGEDNTRDCEYEVCDYKCASAAQAQEDDTTYNLHYYEDDINKIKTSIRDIFGEYTYLHLINLYQLVYERTEGFLNMFTLLRALHTMISNEYIIYNSYGSRCVLREEYNIIYLVNAFETGPMSMDKAYYEKFIILNRQVGIGDMIESKGRPLVISFIRDNIYTNSSISLDKAKAYLSGYNAVLQQKILEIIYHGNDTELKNNTLVFIRALTGLKWNQIVDENYAIRSEILSKSITGNVLVYVPEKDNWIDETLYMKRKRDREGKSGEFKVKVGLKGGNRVFIREDATSKGQTDTNINIIGFITMIMRKTDMKHTDIRDWTQEEKNVLEKVDNHREYFINRLMEGKSTTTFNLSQSIRGKIAKYMGVQSLDKSVLEKETTPNLMKFVAFGKMGIKEMSNALAKYLGQEK